MVIGAGFGFVLSNFRNFNSISEKSTSYIIYILLFFMGLGVGTNKEIMDNFQSIGLQSLIISLFSIAGSVVVSAIVFKIFFKNES
ncbi:MAG: lysine exporter LysO family protein [Bacteroidales bacterium]|nr:lysine exporter LysO family protein [Bacteroidales bacterium]MCF8389239.1 lysine exporter LysO family protein [Bacteroidales bacterium]